MKELLSSVSPKGQVTIPLEVRKLLGIKPRDKVCFRVEGEGVKITHFGSSLEANFQAVPSLKKPVSLSQMTETAREEHVQEAAREGL